MARTPETGRVGQSALQVSAVAWFVPALLGNWLFAYHVAETYLVTALGGDFTAWTDRLFVGLVQGDVAGNTALAVHLVIAFIVSVCGPLQFIPFIRAQAPTFHRWNGRVYISIGVLTSIAALYMVWTRDTFGPDSLELSVSLNGVLILIFAGLTLRYAMARNIDVHQRWALRTFMVMSGVWFLRVMYACLAILTGGNIPGADDVMGGPTNFVVGYASFLLPLAVLELYFLAKRSQSASAKVAMAALVLIAAGATSLGVFGTAMGWLG
jgi:uncharacterized membrane protein